MANEKRGRLREIAALFFKLGVIGFGGPAAHIALMEDEVVEKRAWLSRERFLDLVGVTSIIPGPNSTEMAIHLGFLRGGWPGLLLAGGCFIFPAVTLTTILAWAYMTYGAIPEVADLLYGIKPAVLAVILGALWRLGQKAVKGWRLSFLGLAVMLVSLTQFSGVLALIGGGIIGMFWLRMTRPRDREHMAVIAPIAGTGLTMLASQGAVSAGPTLWALGLFFLKIGAILYGSGYLLIAFLEEELVLGICLANAGAIAGSHCHRPVYTWTRIIDRGLHRLSGHRWQTIGRTRRCRRDLLAVLCICRCSESPLAPAARIPMGVIFSRRRERLCCGIDGRCDNRTGLSIAGFSAQNGNRRHSVHTDIVARCRRSMAGRWRSRCGLAASSLRAFRDESRISQTRSRLPTLASRPDRPHGR